MDLLQGLNPQQAQARDAVRDGIISLRHFPEGVTP